MANRTNHDFVHGPKRRETECHPERLHYGHGLCVPCYHRLRLYGLMPEEFDAMVEEQSNRCLLCGDEMTVPHVDHDHKTGHVRGLLCESCNLKLGWVERIGARVIACYLGVVEPL